MATATFGNVSANHGVRNEKHAGFGAALRSIFTGFRYGVSGNVLQTAAQLGPEQLKEVGGVHDSETGLVYPTR